MSKIEIVNRALMKLGEPPISSLNDVVFGKSYDVIYNDMRKLLLSTYPWRFAVEVAQLNRLEEKKGNKFLYVMPNDCLLLLRVMQGEGDNLLEGYELKYDVMGKCIACEVNDYLRIEYVKDVDAQLFSPLFREALASKLAAEFAMRIKNSMELKQVLDNEFYMLIKNAELNNEIVKNVETISDSSWVLVRQAW